MVKAAVSGAGGKMGDAILSSAAQFLDKITVSGALEHEASSHLRKVINLDNSDSIRITSESDKTIKECDVLIEFSSPQATEEHLRIVKKHKKAMVIGTTGLSEEQVRILEETSKSVPVVFAPNMSVGVNLLFKIVREVTSIIGNDFDIEVIEAHHHHKKDAPSGTAKKIADIIAETLNRNLEEVGVYGRQGMVGARKKDEIGIHVIRGGDIVGDHTVLFAGQGERIEITHKAHSRTTFAVGAIRAAIFAATAKPGLYTMDDVLYSNKP